MTLTRSWLAPLALVTLVACGSSSATSAPETTGAPTTVVTTVAPTTTIAVPSTTAKAVASTAAPATFLPPASTIPRTLIPTTLPPTTLPPTTLPPTTVDPAIAEREADLALIEPFWPNYSEAWALSWQEGLDFIQGNQHPEVPLDMESCNRNYAKDFAEEIVVDLSSVAPAGDWQVPVGGWDVEGDGSTFTPSGRVYVMTVESDVYGVLELHLAIIDGRAYSFWSCTDA